MKKIVLSLILFFLVINIVTATITFSGNCTLNQTCYINTLKYNATIRGCSVMNLTWNETGSFEWAYGTLSAQTTGIGQMYTSLQIIAPYINTTTATITTNTSSLVEINCIESGGFGHNFWQFSDNYFNLTQNYTGSSTFYNANYLKKDGYNSTPFNSTTNLTTVVSPNSLTSVDTFDGIIGMAFQSNNNYIFAIAYDNSLTNTTSVRYNNATTTSLPTLNPGRNSTIAANRSFHLTYGVIQRNESESGDAKYTNALKQFKATYNYTPPIIVPQTEYYFSQLGDDANLCNSTSPCKTIAKMNLLSLNAGDKIYFNRGDIWRVINDSLPILKNGSGANKIVYTAYGTGNKPLFLGSLNFSSTGNWTSLGGNLWTTFYNISLDVGNIIFTNDESTGIRVQSVSNVDNQGKWHYNETTNYLVFYSSLNPYTYYGNIEIAVKPATQEMMWNFDDKSNIVLSNLSMKYTGVGFLNGERMKNISWLDNELQFGGGDWQTTTRYGNCMDIQLNASNIEVSGNNVSQCYDGALTIESYVSGGQAIVENLNIHHNLFTYSHYPIEYFSSTSTSIASNIIINHNTLAYSGEQWAYNERFGTGMITTSRNRFSRTPSTTTGFNFSENIILKTKDYSFYMGEAVGYWNAPFYIDYNLWYTNNTYINITFNNTNYKTLTLFKTANPSEEINGNEISPFFVSGTYTPIYGSPACTMSSTGSFVGALPCAAQESVPPGITIIITPPSDINTTITTRPYTTPTIQANESVRNCTLNFNGIVYTMEGSNFIDFYYNFTSLPNGNYSYNATCTDFSDNLGNSTKAWVYMNWSVVAPVVTLNSPINTTLTTKGGSFSCTASDNNGLSNVTLFLGATAYYNTSPTNNTMWVNSVVLSNGNYTWYCAAYDLYGAITNSSIAWIMISYVTTGYDYTEGVINITVENGVSSLTFLIGAGLMFIVLGVLLLVAGVMKGQTIYDMDIPGMFNNSVALVIGILIVLLGIIIIGVMVAGILG
jgi:hypothetical protein